jgi:hypothetical protein
VEGGKQKQPILTGRADVPYDIPLPEADVSPSIRFPAFILLACIAAHAAAWKNDSLRVRINLPGTWKFITPKMADQRLTSAKDDEGVAFYSELKKRTQTGDLFVFEKSPKSKVRADLQTGYLGKPLGRVLAEQDIRNLCPLWAANPAENEIPFLDCQPRKLGIAWTALLTYQTGPEGKMEYQIKYFRPDGRLILFTVAGSKTDAEALFKNIKFY